MYLEMGFETTIDFKGNKKIEIETSGRDHYRITVLLTVVADGTKLTPIVIVKGAEGKIIENHLRKLDFVKNNQILVDCQEQGWCTNIIFIEWIKNVLLPYERTIKEKCLVVLDQATCHISNDSIDALNKNDIKYILIPKGMTSICQPLDISVNKVFKDSIRLLFERERL